MRVSAILSLSVCLFAVGPASADTLVVTGTTAASGLYVPQSGSPSNFTDVAVVFTYSGDTKTSQAFNPSYPYINYGGTLTVSFSGLGTANGSGANYGTATFRNRYTGAYGGGISVAGSRPGSADDFAFVTMSPVFSTYNLASDLGPVTGLNTAVVGGYAGEGFFTLTNGALVQVNSYSPSSTYQASVISSVPEPSTFVLLGTTFVGMAAVSSRQARRR